MYQLANIHYNSKGVPQVSPNETFEDLETTLSALKTELSASSQLEQNMLSFFLKEVEPQLAYRDNDVGQGYNGPRRLHVIGKLRKITVLDGLFVRLGISAPGEHSLIPTFQVLYLQPTEHPKYLLGMEIGTEQDADRLFYDFTERYKGMTNQNVRTRLGIRSLAIIPMINEILLSDSVRELEGPKY